MLGGVLLGGHCLFKERIVIVTYTHVLVTIRRGLLLVFWGHHYGIFSPKARYVCILLLNENVLCLSAMFAQTFFDCIIA